MAEPFDTIKRQNDYCGITKWHENGITGKDVVVWNTEGNTEHGQIVTRRIYDSATNCTVLSASLSMSYNNTTIHSATVTYNNTVYGVEDFINRFNVKIITRSIGGGTGTGMADSKFWNTLKEKYKLIFFNSAGNDDYKGCGGSLPSDVAIWIGAVDLVKGKPQRANYSSVGEELDFVSFTGVWSGTSFSAPYMAGITALLVQKFGANIDQDFVYEYFKSHSQDLEELGVDYKTGYGLPILGDPNEEVKPMELKLKIDSNIMLVDGKEYVLPQAPILYNNKTMLPIREVLVALGIKDENIKWNQATKEVTIIK